MANLHVLQKNGPDISVVAHIPVPVSNNTAGVSWQAALINSGLGGLTILKDGDGTAGTISSSEKAQIVAGTVFEAQDTIRVDTVSGGAAAINAYLDAQFSAIQTRWLSRIQDQLKWFGGTR